MRFARKRGAGMWSQMNWLRFVDVGVYLALAIVAGMHWRNDAHHWIGAVISAPFFFLWMLARYQLGASFAVRAEAKKLVTHGIYSKIRNPIYVFGGLAIVGLFVVHGWYMWTAIFVLFNLFQYFRVRREEQVLTEAFGDEYRAYKARTWF
jgi:protein-S-isoprenylcysteine O-methyltransferase Ste14